MPNLLRCMHSKEVRLELHYVEYLSRMLGCNITSFYRTPGSD